MTLKTLTFDPGEKNFAYAILEHKYSNTLQSRVIKNGILNTPIKHLNNRDIFIKESTAFHNEINRLLSNNLDIVSVERFMGRGIRVGTMSETVNIMIGVLIIRTKSSLNIFPNFIHPATWKNAYNRAVVGGLENCYKLCGASNHQLDAALIGIYSASIHYNIKPFSSINTNRKRDKLLLSIEKSSQTRLIKRRKKRKYFT